MTAKIGPTEPLTLRDAEAFDMTSSTGASYRVFVGLPASYGRTGKTYPVIYVLDADFVFCSMLEQVRLRGLLGETAEMIVVGIGYPINDNVVMPLNHRRIHDFSTTDQWEPSGVMYQNIAAALDALGQPFELGGAPALLDFITNEVQPLISDRYRVDGADLGLYAASAAGNFAAYALLTRPEAFAKYIISSPGLGFNDSEIFNIEENYAQSHSDLVAQVYLAAGAPEMEQFAPTGFMSSFVRMAELLLQRSYPGLRLVCEIISDKTHVPAHFDTMLRGIDLLWPGQAYDINGAGDRLQRKMQD